MPDVEIKVEGLVQLQKKLGRLETMQAMEAPMQRAVTRIQSELKHYPGPPTQRGTLRYATPRAQRYFWWALRHGKIQVPYRRTGKLGQAWTTRVRRTGEGLEGVVSNKLKYAPYVQGPEQARIHWARWDTVKIVMKITQAAVIDEFNREIKRLLAFWR